MDHLQNAVKTLWESSVVGLAIVDADGRWVDANPAMCRFLEYSLPELQSRNFQNLTHPEDVEVDERLANSVIAGRVAGYDLVKRYITKSGRVVWANLRVSAIVDGRGSFVAFLSQVSPLVPVEAATRTAEKRASFRWQWIKDYWAQILFGIGALAALLAEIFRYLKGGK